MAVPCDNGKPAPAPFELDEDFPETPDPWFQRFTEDGVVLSLRTFT